MAVHRVVRTWMRLLATVAVIALLPSMMGATATAAEEPDPHKRHAEFVKQYGDIGCRVVPGFNDRCPITMSEPYHPPGDGNGYIHPDYFTGSPNGDMVYAVGLQRDWDQGGNPYHRAAVVAYRTTPDEPATDGSIVWSQAFGEVGDLPGILHQPTSVAVSHDGRYLYVLGRAVYSGMLNWLPHGAWVAAFDTDNGELLWERSVRHLVGSSSQPVAGVSGEPWIESYDVVVSPDDTQIAISTRVEYAEAWRLTELDEDIARNVSNAWYFALNARSGALDWKAQYVERVPNFPANTGEGLKYAPDGSRLYAQVNLYERKQLYKGIGTLALDVTTGELLWDQADYKPTEDGRQNPPAGIIVSPDGSQIFAAGPHYFVDSDTGRETGSIRLLAYDSGEGTLLWSREYEAIQSGCNSRFEIMTPGRAMTASPSGDLVYLVGSDGDDSDGCGSAELVLGPRVLAVRASTGQLAWDRLITDSAGLSCIPLYTCDLVVVPGPDGGDTGSRVVVTTWFKPHRDGFSNYLLTLALDGEYGNLEWQGDRKSVV